MSARLIALLAALTTVLGGVGLLGSDPSFVSGADVARAKRIITRSLRGEPTTRDDQAFAAFVRQTVNTVDNARKSNAAMYISGSVASYPEVRVFPENLMCYQSRALPLPVPPGVVRAWSRDQRRMHRGGVEQTLPSLLGRERAP